MLSVTLASVQSDGYIFPPFGIGVIGSYVYKITGCKPTVLGFSAKATAEAIARKIAAGKPDVVGLSVYIWSQALVLNAARHIRTALPDCVIVLGGPQVFASGHEFLSAKNDGTVDALIEGEAECAVANLIIALQGSDKSHMRGMAQARESFASHSTVSMDDLVHPTQRYSAFRKAATEFQLAHVEGSRGCPYKCNFCDQGWRPVRRPSDDKVVDDMQNLMALGVRKICFVDPTFNFDRSRHLKILDFMMSRNIALHAEIKADILSQDEISALSMLKASSIEIGLQSSREETLAAIGRRTNMSRMATAISQLAATELSITVNTIFGLPSEGFDDWMRSLDFAYHLGDTHITANWLKILPNTDLWRQKSLYEMEALPGTLGQIASSSTWSLSELITAARMAIQLSRVQRFHKHRKVNLRREIRSAHGGSLAKYLYSAAMRRSSGEGSLAQLILAA